jgi:hypothetical protein
MRSWCSNTWEIWKAEWVISSTPLFQAEFPFGGFRIVADIAYERQRIIKPPTLTVSQETHTRAGSEL